MSIPFRLIVPRALVEAMVAQAQAELPAECCGLLAGVLRDGVGRVEVRYPLVNALASPTEYLSDARSMFEAHRDMTKRSLDVLAVYHSHPASAPIPSRKDRAQNYSEEVVNLIISLTTTPPLIRGWWLTAESHREAEWSMSDE
ncbi:MAG: M67 family metallopeptidase [Gemmataceae bacterium]